MNKDEALKMRKEQDEYWSKIIKKAEEALEQPTMTYEQGFAHGYEAHRVEQELEQPAQEPVAWIDDLDDSDVISHAVKIKLGCSQYSIPLYTHPAPSWQGLSDEEIEAVTGEDIRSLYSGTYEAYRAIEQALKEKNVRNN